MGCCGGGQAVWREFAPVARFQLGNMASVMAVSSNSTADGSTPCCDACAIGHDDPAPSCATGACGVPQTAGIPMPVRHALAQAGAVQLNPATRRVSTRPAPLSAQQEAGLDRYAQAWAKATGARQAGVVMAVTAPGFRASTEAEIRALSDLALYERETDLVDLEFSGASPQQLVELSRVRAETERREQLDPAETGGDEDLSRDDGEGRPLSDEEWEEKRAAIARETANNLEPGDDPASRARRDRIIAQAVGGTFAAFNNYLTREYDARVEGIRGSTAITLARLRNEDRAADREYRLAIGGGAANPAAVGGGTVATVSILGILLALASRA